MFSQLNKLSPLLPKLVVLSDPSIYLQLILFYLFLDGFLMFFCLLFDLVFLSSCIGSRNSTKPENGHSVITESTFLLIDVVVFCKHFILFRSIFLSAFDGVFGILFGIDFSLIFEPFSY